MFDCQGRGDSALEAGDSVEAGGGPVGEEVGDDLGGLAGANSDEVAVAHTKLDFGVGGLVGVEELEVDTARGEDVLAGLGQVIEDEHGGLEGVVGHGGMRERVGE